MNREQDIRAAASKAIGGKEVITGKDEKVNYIAQFDGLVDIVKHEGKPMFLLKEGFKVVPSMIVDGRKHLPPPAEQLNWVLPRLDKVQQEYVKYADSSDETDVTEETDPPPECQKVLKSLFDDLVEYHKSISDLPDECLYDLLAAWDFHTYRHQEVEYSPEMEFFAVPERGKSRTGKAMIYVAYRGVHIVSIREAYIFRQAELCNATLFFDITNFWKTIEKNSSEDLILNRFEKGGRVPRVLWPEKGDFKDTKFYSVYGPTILASNTALSDVLGTRTLTTVMQDSEREFDADVSPLDGLPFRERLVAYRAKFMNTPLPRVGKPAKKRLGDIMRPLIAILTQVSPDKVKDCLAFITNLEQGIISRKSEGLEGRVIAAMLALENEVSGGVLALKRITAEINKDNEDQRFNFAPKTIASMLEALGLRGTASKRQRMGDGSVAIPYNLAQLEKLAESYGIDTSNDEIDTSDDSDTPPQGQFGQLGQFRQKETSDKHYMEPEDTTARIEDIPL